MTTNRLIPAAQYHRMSTEHQQYSLDGQSTAIQAYASLHGFEIVQTYSDSAKSGVVLKHRTGLQQLLQDVVRGTQAYQAILVYDVSRWGRFQDTDEAAHYEFLCKSAGVPIHYCAETFANDGTLPSLIMKALKRTMAGEYSRELGVKVLAGQRRLAQLGFKLGGRAGYGLRRVLVAPDRSPKQVLEFGERKSIATDRVIFALGPADEVQCVRDIFRMLVSEKRTVHAIACELNRRGIRYTGTSKWDYQAVNNILTHPKYMGCQVLCRTSQKLYGPTVKLPKSEWVITPSAFEAIVDPSTFELAQTILQARTHNKSNDQILDELKALLAIKGRLTLKLIKESPNVASPSALRCRFGSLGRAYSLIGYGRPEQFSCLEMRRRTRALRDELIAQIVEAGPGQITAIRRGGRWRKRLRLASGLNVSVFVARAARFWKDAMRWVLYPHYQERNLVALLARLNPENTEFMDFHVFRRIVWQKKIHILLKDPWLRSGVRLKDLSQLARVARSMRTSGIHTKPKVKS